MKLGEKLEECSGVSVPAVERLKIPELNLSLDLFCGDEPSTLALGCTFSREVCRAVSLARVESAAREFRSFAGNIACGVMTDPMREDGVDFFSDDPYLVGELLSAYADVDLGYVFTDALGQGRFERRTVDERALHEVYLRPLVRAGRLAAGLVLDGGSLNDKEIFSTRALYDMYARLVPRDAVIFSLEFGNDERSAGVFRLGATAADNKAVARAVTDGAISEKKIDFCIERTIAAAAKAHEFYKNREQSAERAAPSVFFDSAVLLENEILPVSDEPVLFGDRSYFDDGKQYSVYDITDGVKRCGKLNLFFVTDELGEAQRLAVENVANKRDTIVAVCGRACELGFAKDAKAVLFLPYAPRISDVVELIRGKEPRGRLPFAWGVKRCDHPRNNKRFAPRGDFRFASVYGGHAYFDTFVKPLYPFGHGLSFTRFEIEKAVVKSADFAAQLTVANAGKRRGGALVEAYATYRGNGAFGIVKRLVGFARVELGVGEKKNIEIALDMSSVRAYDADNQKYVTVGGKYEIEFGFSSLDIRAKAEVKLEGTSGVGFSRKDLPDYYGDTLEPTAPEIERLFGISFVKKSEPKIPLPDGKRVKKSLAKIKKRTGLRAYASAAYKIAHTPAEITDRLI